jgi:twinkle protein
MSSCVAKIKHNVPHCTSEKGLQVFYDDVSGKYTGYCFSCAARGEEAYVADPYSGHAPKDLPKGKTKEEIEAEVAEIRALGPPLKAHRGIPAEYFKRAGVRLAYSEFDGKTPFSFNFPHSKDGKLLSFKTIMLDKKAMWSVGDGKGCDLYNWENAKKKGVKRLYITEGHWDCHTLEYMLESQCDNKYQYAVTSIPNGVGSAASTIGRMRKEIESLFSEVVLCFDADEPGELAVKEVQKVMPGVLEAPHVSGVKDANDALDKGKQATFVEFALWKARKPPIEGVVTVSQAIERGSKAPVMGLSYPWPTLTKVMYGQRFGETTCVAGAVGGGKTCIAHETAAHNIITHNVPVFMALLEEENTKTCWNVAGKIDKLQYIKPEVYEENKDRYFETARQLEDKLLLWNSAGGLGYRFDLPEILNAIRFNTLEYGCKFHYIDNMTRLADQMKTSEANEFINKYSSEIANLANELGVHIYLFSHLNPPKGKDARTHEEGAPVQAAEITGSRGIMRSFPNLLGFERNQMAEGELQHNSFISILKSRDYGEKLKVKTRYNPKTGKLLEYNWEGSEL